ncbi:MAG: hypothetical protein WCD28_09870, partial [Nitrososphaeraceae archaeon]
HSWIVNVSLDTLSSPGGHFTGAKCPVHLRSHYSLLDLFSRISYLYLLLTIYSNVSLPSATLVATSMDVLESPLCSI